MAYEKTRALMAKHDLDDSSLREIIGTYAEELEAQEPHATNAIGTARTLSEEFGTED